MNRQPVYYMQTDPEWADKPYYSTGGYNTIGKSGCGPTCAAMLISTMTGKKFTPVDACKWAVEHGHRTANQGTAYAYFEPQFEAHGITCKMLNWQNSYGKTDHANHKEAFDLLKKGYYLIAVMGKGLWTSSGHFVVVWWEDGWVHINDPASKASLRLNGDLKTFKSQVKYYWYVDARKHNKNGKAAADTTSTKKEAATVKVELPVLQKGCKGAAVESAQALLNAAGYDCGKVDGKAGPKFDAATRQYQRDHKLTVDGKWGPQMYGSFLPC